MCFMLQGLGLQCPVHTTFALTGSSCNTLVSPLALYTTTLQPFTHSYTTTTPRPSTLFRPGSV